MITIITAVVVLLMRRIIPPGMNNSKIVPQLFKQAVQADLLARARFEVAHAARAKLYRRLARLDNPMPVLVKGLAGLGYLFAIWAGFCHICIENDPYGAVQILYQNKGFLARDAPAALFDKRVIWVIMPDGEVNILEG